MQLLSVTAALDRFHQKIFSRDKRQILPDRPVDELLIDKQAFAHILRQTQNRVGTEKRFRQRNPTVG